jgi:hypothetical protein
MVTTYSTAPFNCSGYPEIRYYKNGTCDWYVWYSEMYTIKAANFFPTRFPTRFPTQAPVTKTPVKSAAPSVTISPTQYRPSNMIGSSASYVVTALYSDSACKTFFYGSFQRLNTCHRSIDDENLYVIIMATDNTLTTTTYADSMCKLLHINQNTSWFTNNACVGMTRISHSTNTAMNFGNPIAVIR